MRRERRWKAVVTEKKRGSERGRERKRERERERERERGELPTAGLNRLRVG
jgi:hypothetical protein